jgi:hypothetical protein
VITAAITSDCHLRKHLELDRDDFCLSFFVEAAMHLLFSKSTKEVFKVHRA